MNYFKIATLCNSFRIATISSPQSVVTRNYAKAVAALGAKKKKMGKLGPVAEKKIMPVETDANRLVNYVCGSNIYTSGEDIKIKPNEEYPDWLWSINVGAPLTLDQMDPETKQYWRRLRKGALKRNNQLAKLRTF